MFATAHETHMFMTSKIRGVILVTFLFLAIRVSAAPEVQWEHVYPHPTAKWLSAIAWGPPGFVAAGQDGEILFSADAINWRRITASGVSNGWFQAACYSDGKYVVVGSGDLIVLSTDGQDWTVVNSGTNGLLNGCAAGAGIFAAVGFDQTLFLSTNGTEWQKRSTPATFVDIGFGNGIWIALTGGDTIYASSNLVDWTSVETGFFGPALTSICFGNGQFVVGGAGRPDEPNGVSYGTAIKASTDGLNWIPVNGLDSFGEIRSLAFAGGQFVAALKSRFLRSGDGISWEHVSAPDVGGDFAGVAASDGGQFVAVGSKGAMLRSENAVVWDVISKEPRVEIHSIAWARGRFIAVGGSPTYLGGPLGDAAILSSTNGREWQAALTNLTEQLTGVAYGKGVWVVTGDNGQIFTSRDGLNWRNRNLPPTSHDLQQVVYGRGVFIAFASWRDLVYRSANGRRWRASEAQFASEIWKAKFLQRRFIGVGGDEDGFIFTSRNGTRWTKKTLPGAGWLAGVAYGAKRYVAAGRSASAVSFDGANWSVHPTPRIVYDLQYIDDWFVGVGPNGMIFSRDGMEWQVSTQSDLPASLGLLSSGAGTLVGSYGPTLYLGALQDN